MSHTPSPTVIEEARKMAEGFADTRGWLMVKPVAHLEAAFIAAIELGERRAEAAVVGQTAQMLRLAERAAGEARVVGLQAALKPFGDIYDVMTPQEQGAAFCTFSTGTRHLKAARAAKDTSQ